MKRKRPSQKQKRCKKGPAAVTKASNIKKQPSKIIKSVFGLLSTAIGYLIFVPDVSVSPYTTLDPKKPLETRFSVTNNNSIYAITDVQYNCELSLHIFGGGRWAASERVGLDVKERLGPKEQFSIFCGDKMPDGKYYSLLPEETYRALNNETLNIYIHFKIPLYPGLVTRSYGFLLMRTNDDNAQWMPLGSAKPLLGITF